MALFTAGAVGMVIAQKACIAGAQGGCQAECGSAAAMAAAALVELQGGQSRPVGPRLCHRPEKPAGASVRPGGRTGGDPLHQAQCGRRSHRLFLRGDGPGRSGEQDPGG